MLTVDLYVSHNALPPSEDDELLAEALRRRGASVEIVAWDDPQERWSDLGIICSTWDYTLRFAEFSDWLHVVDRNCMLLNPLAIIRRTLDKRYLLELSEVGVATVPTRLTSSDPEDIRAVALEQRWSELILKPLVSAGGRHILRSTPDTVPELPPPVSGSPEGWLVQPLLPAIAAGEYSCVFIAGKLTHAVLKRPAAGDFRVQSHYGGRTTLATPPDDVYAAAVRALQVLGTGHLYARVDVVVDPDLGALVMEVEMVEPDLFLRLHEQAAAQLATAAVDRFNSAAPEVLRFRPLPR